MTENKIFLPIGSVVVLNGSSVKILIIQRAVKVESKESITYFDYGAILYPDGLIGEGILYFNSSDIFKVIFKGYSDESDKLVIEEINASLTKMEEEKDKVIDPLVDESENGGEFNGF